VQSADYDYYFFAEELPGTVCMTKKCHPDMMGNMGPKDTNMHGLWPNKEDGNHPFFCDVPNIYSDQLLSSATLAKMDKEWVGVFNSTYWFRNILNNRFRYHEYMKHGSCFEEPN